MHYKPITGPDDPRITIAIHAQQDDVPVRGNALASGDDNEDRRVEDEILQRLSDGDIWAWAHVEVAVYASGVKMMEHGTVLLIDTWASDSLGCCSYESEEDFRIAGDYYEDMVNGCIQAINDKLEGMSNLLDFSQ